MPDPCELGGRACPKPATTEVRVWDHTKDESAYSEQMYGCDEHADERIAEAIANGDAYAQAPL